MSYKITLHSIINLILVFFLTSQMVFSTESKEAPIKLQKTLKLTADYFEKNNFWFLFRFPDEGNRTQMTTSFFHQHFDYKNFCHWYWWSSQGKTELQKYDLLSQIREEYPCPLGFPPEKPVQGASIDRRFPDRSKLEALLPYSRYLENNLVISPNEKYVIVRMSLELHVLSEVKTGRILTDKLPENEIILGFDSQSNIYCGRLLSPPKFVVRNPETMQVVRSFRRSIGDDTAEHGTVEQDLFYAICPLPVESPDRKYVVFQFYQHRPPGVTAKLYENDPRLLKEWVTVDEDAPSYNCVISEVHVYDQESGLLVYEAPFGIGGWHLMSNLRPIINSDGNKILYPDNASKGVWVYDFEKRESRSLMIPPPKIPNNLNDWQFSKPGKNTGNS